jgi:hypothetical protein
MNTNGDLFEGFDKKQCTGCKTYKPLSEFYKSGSRHGGHSHCKACHIAAAHVRKSHNPEAFMLISARYRAKKNGLPCTISESDIVIPERCPVFKFPLRVHPGKPQFNSPTLDRIDNRLGYVPDNVVVISERANTLKRDATPEELEQLAAYLRLLRT